MSKKIKAFTQFDAARMLVYYIPCEGAEKFLADCKVAFAVHKQITKKIMQVDALKEWIKEYPSPLISIFDISLLKKIDQIFREGE